MNKKKNKGFSLIELIVVVAIMAVLVGVLAPTYLKYVDKTRVQKDVSAVGEVVQAIKVAAADEDVNTALKTKKEYTISTTAATLDTDNDATNDDALTKELKNIIGKVEITSNAITSVKISAELDASGNVKIVVTPTLKDATDTELKNDLESIGTEKPAA